MRTTLEAAARQAAARLYAAADFLDAVHRHPHSTWNCRATIDDCRVAADTLREALAEQQAAEPVSVPALVGVLATLPAHIKEAVEAYGAACARVALLATHSAPTQQAAGPLSFNCSAGCGACGVKLQDFVTHQTQAQEGDEWVVVDAEPQVVSACCGSPVEVWDERKKDIVARVEAAQQQAQPTQQPLTDEQIGSAIKDWMGLSDPEDEPSVVEIARAIEAAHGITGSKT